MRASHASCELRGLAHTLGGIRYGGRERVRDGRERDREGSRGRKEGKKGSFDAVDFMCPRVPREPASPARM